MNFLIVCSKNKWRSRTAESIFKNNGLHLIRSAGTSPGARIKLTQHDINWAHLIFVMEDKHKNFILNHFELGHGNQKIQVLGIEDRYDPELIDLLKSSVAKYLH